jgi:hypothetical protein
VLLLVLCCATATIGAADGPATPRLYTAKIFSTTAACQGPATNVSGLLGACQPHPAGTGGSVQVHCDGQTVQLIAFDDNQCRTQSAGTAPANATLQACAATSSGTSWVVMGCTANTTAALSAAVGTFTASAWVGSRVCPQSNGTSNAPLFLSGDIGACVINPSSYGFMKVLNCSDSALLIQQFTDHTCQTFKGGGYEFKTLVFICNQFLPGGGASSGSSMSVKSCTPPPLSTSSTGITGESSSTAGTREGFSSTGIAGTGGTSSAMGASVSFSKSTCGFLALAAWHFSSRISA